jgi:anti-sigma regulatory factor (Ser/Thr protein kinase)
MPSNHRPSLVEVDEATVPCGPQAPSLARVLVARWLDGHGHAELREDACLLVSELVTNSVTHAGQPAGAPLQIRTSAVKGVVRIEVEDAGHGAVRPRAPEPGRGGLGLHLVDTLAARWGVESERGTHVWFELAAHGGGPT